MTYNVFNGTLNPTHTPVDIVCAKMIVWRIRHEIIRTVLCCVVYDIVHNDVHTFEQFLKMSVGLGLVSVFVHLFRFSI